MTDTAMQVCFVFGSNLAGRHGKGAALHARKKWGAAYGVGEGPTGAAYAIPTKDESLNVLPLACIEASIKRFLDYADMHPELLFLLTPVGTGLAGYTKDQIAMILRKYGVPSNVALTSTWLSSDHKPL